MSILRRNLIQASVILAAVALVSAVRAENHALIIGIDEYQDRNNINTLSAASADAKAIAKVMEETAGFKTGNIRLLTSDGALKPTGSNIVFELEQLAKRVKADDVVFVFYSGHGIMMDGSPYLIPWDADARTETTMKRTAVPASAFQEQLGKLPARALILAFDMCRADPRKGARDITPTNSFTQAQARTLQIKARVSDRDAGPQATITLFSSRPGERSWEWRAKGRGFFSYYLEQGLRNGAADAGGVVRIKNLVSYLEKAVSGAVQREEGKEQMPYSIVEGVGASDLMLASGRPAGAGGATAVAVVVNGTLKEKFDSVMQEGTELYNANRYREAQVKFAVAVELDPMSFIAVNELAKAHDRQKHYPEAEQYYRKAIALNPNSTPPNLQLAMLLHTVKHDYVEAEKLFRKAMELEPNLALPVGSLAHMYFYGKNDAVEAEKLYLKAMELDPNCSLYVEGLAAVYFYAKEDFAQAEKLYRKAIELDPTDALACNSLAHLLATVKKDYVEAERLYRKAIDLMPDLGLALTNFADLLFKIKKDFVEAERLYRKALDIDPADLTALNHLADLFCDVKKDYAEGERLYRKAVELEPDDVQSVFNLANLIYDVKMNYAEAERLYRKTIKLEPKQGFFYAMLAATLHKQNKRDEAVDAAKKAIQLGEKKHWIFEDLGLKP